MNKVKFCIKTKETTTGKFTLILDKCFDEALEKRRIDTNQTMIRELYTM